MTLHAPFFTRAKKQQFQKNSVILSKLYHFLMLYMGNPPLPTFFNCAIKKNIIFPPYSKSPISKNSVIATKYNSF